MLRRLIYRLTPKRWRCRLFGHTMKVTPNGDYINITNMQRLAFQRSV